MESLDQQSYSTFILHQYHQYASLQRIVSQNGKRYIAHKMIFYFKISHQTYDVNVTMYGHPDPDPVRSGNFERIRFRPHLEF
jgi:hypothetical protein